MAIEKAHLEDLRQGAELVLAGEASGINVAGWAVAYGGLLVGAPRRKARHTPAPRREHRYHSLVEDEWRNWTPPGVTHALKAGQIVEFAAECAFFGNCNSSRQRMRRCMPITGTSRDYFGYGYDQHKTEARAEAGLWQPAGVSVTTHIHPALYKEAINPSDPYTGWIHVIEHDESFKPTGHEVGQYYTLEAKPTLVYIYVRGNKDLELDTLKTTYERVETASAAGQPPT